MTGSEAALLSLAAAMGGAMNAVAGGGSFLTFPALVFAGMPPIVANATSTVALWPGSVASVAAYRRELAADRRTARVYGLAALLGGVAGALLLVRTPPGAFARLVPWLLLLATVTFSFGGALRARLGHRAPARRHAGPAAFLVQLAIAVYGGYFGGGMGMMMLAAFTVFGMTDIHQMNGFKSALGVAINGVAVVTFVAAGIVAWTPALLMVLGASLGGYGGAALARRIEPRLVRRFAAAAGWVMTAVFFARAG